MDVYNRIDSLLEKKGISKKQMCVDAGINYTSYMSSYRRKSNKLPFDTITVIASYLNIPVGYLLDTEFPGGVFISDEMDIEHFKVFNNLNKSGKAKVTQYARDITYEYGKKARVVTKYFEDNQDEEKRMLPLYEYPASAGQGAFSGYGDYELVEVPDAAPASTSFGVLISGESMEPDIPDGSIVWVRQQPSVDVGQVCIVIINDEGYCKRLGEKEFESINPDYKNIRPGISDDVRISGLVVYVQPPWEQ